VGKHLINLDIGLPVDDLRKPMRETLANGIGSHLEIPAVTRRGRQVRSRVSLMPLVGGDGEARGLIMLTQADGVDGGSPS
jgi:two-component system CheB/CheR fusion protein